MDMRKLSIIGAVAIIAVVACSAAFASQDNVIQLDGMQFNTTNITKFVIDSVDEFDGGNLTNYVDEDKLGYGIGYYNLSDYNESEFDYGCKIIEEYEINDSSDCQTIDGIKVYSVTATNGTHIGDARYSSVIWDKDSKTVVSVSTPEINETIKIISTLEFV